MAGNLLGLIILLALPSPVGYNIENTEAIRRRKQGDLVGIVLSLLTAFLLFLLALIYVVSFRLLTF